MKLEDIITTQQKIEESGGSIVNDIIKKIELYTIAYWDVYFFIAHFENFRSQEAFCDVGDVGYVMRAFIKFFDLYEKDCANLSVIENTPCRLAVAGLNCIGIGHPTEDRFILIGEFLKINE